VARELLMPKLGLTMTEGLLAEWVVQPGDAYEQDDCLYIVETEKVTNEIAADRAGTFLEAVVGVGETVPVGTVVGRVDDGTESTAAASDSGAAGAAEASASDTDTSAPAAGSSAPAQSPAAAAPSSTGERIIASPLARRLAREGGMDLATVTGTGPGGRIVARDIHAAEEAPSQTAQTATSPQDAAGAAASPAAQASSSATHTLIEPTRMQRTIAQRLTQSKQQAPHFYLALDADMSTLTELRKTLNAQRESRGLRPFTINDFIVKAVAASLNSQPQANQVWSDEGIKQFHHINVGVAVDTDNGLVAPTVAGLDSSSLADVASLTHDVVRRARDNALLPDDMAEAAITVSNAGMHNVTYMGSIINPGQAMILGVGAIKPVFRPDSAGQPELRHEMGLVLSADHRITDGVRALEFLNRVVKFLEQPLMLLAE